MEMMKRGSKDSKRQKEEAHEEDHNETPPATDLEVDVVRQGANLAALQHRVLRQEVAKLQVTNGRRPKPATHVWLRKTGSEPQSNKGILASMSRNR